ncbi:MAG: hypothetical protein H8E61_07555 [Bacteroidetes bacterium]|nr:hypothetical protein [Bacteroidota bacterium]
MDKKKFESVFPIICSALAGLIADTEGLTEEESISKLYTSRLYEKLENEETKVWYYSTEKLFDLFKEEMSTGKITFPEA